MRENTSEYMRRCEHFADMTMLRALYLSWRSATQMMEQGRVKDLSEGILWFTR